MIGIEGGGSGKEDYAHLLESVKPRGARYLQEKFCYWMEYHIPKTRQKIAKELDSGKERLLFLGMFSSIFRDYHVIERTGYTFRALHPGIEFEEEFGPRKVFDALLQGNDGTSLFILYLGNQNVSPNRFLDSISVRFGFLNERKEEFTKGYDIDDKIRLGILLSGREKPAVRKGLQLLGTSGVAREVGEVHVLELSPAEGTLHGFPSIRHKDSDTIEFPDGLLLDTPPLDLMTQEYLLFELTAVQGCYAEHLMEDHSRPKEITRKEMETALFRDMGLTRKEKSVLAKNHEKRKAFARKKLDSALQMALRFNLIEGNGGTENGQSGMKGQAGMKGKASTGGGNKMDGPYRIICQGSDLTMVRNNLLKKYLDGMAAELASSLAGKKAVEAYRRRYPRIDMKF